MNMRKEVRGIRKRVRRSYDIEASKYWGEELENPIFIVGSFRSGTTILGEITRSDPRYLYLHEPFYFWSAVDRQLDIWGRRYPLVDARLHWGAEDYDPTHAKLIRRWFYRRLAATRGQRLVEKSPVNAHRLGWLAKIFPKAKFVHIIRHPRDAALSIDIKVAKRDALYWAHSLGWGMRVLYAYEIPELWSKLDYISESADNYARGLFSWMCSIHDAQTTAPTLPDGSYMEVRYEDLIRNPEETITAMNTFTGEPVSEAMLTFAKENLHQKSVQKTDPNPELTQNIVGDFAVKLGYEL